MEVIEQYKTGVEISELYIKLDHQNMLAGSGDSHQDEIKQGVMMSESTVVCTICGETVKCSARDDYYYNHAGMKFVCPECKEKYKCQSCDGKGKIFDDREHMSFPCKLCEGAGLVRTKEEVCAAQTKTAFLSGVGKRKLSSMTDAERIEYSTANFNVHCGMGAKDHFAITKWFAERGFNVWGDK
ncbi:MAG: hypothetical protein WC907_06045 [Acholeplasmataceae bacterium]